MQENYLLIYEKEEKTTVFFFGYVFGERERERERERETAQKNAPNSQNSFLSIFEEGGGGKGSGS